MCPDKNENITKEKPVVKNPAVRCSPTMSGKQRRFLRALGHPLKPVVWIGKKGISPELLENMEDALLTHELIKVKVGKDLGYDLGEVADNLHMNTGAQIVQVIGRTLLCYKKHPKKAQIRLPKKQNTPSN